jgi:hypothetical protein
VTDFDIDRLVLTTTMVKKGWLVGWRFTIVQHWAFPTEEHTNFMSLTLLGLTVFGLTVLFVVLPCRHAIRSDFCLWQLLSRFELSDPKMLFKMASLESTYLSQVA